MFERVIRDRVLKVHYIKNVFDNSLFPLMSITDGNFIFTYLMCFNILDQCNVYDCLENLGTTSMGVAKFMNAFH